MRDIILCLILAAFFALCYYVIRHAERCLKKSNKDQCCLPAANKPQHCRPR